MNGPLLATTQEWYKSSDVSLIRPRIHNMPASDTSTQRTQALALLKLRGMTRLAEFSASGITATTVGRMERAGEVVRLARGLYQLPDWCPKASSAWPRHWHFTASPTRCRRRSG
jgi:Transcriptional regulator, AbiEi antitoxin